MAGLARHVLVEHPDVSTWFYYRGASDDVFYEDSIKSCSDTVECLQPRDETEFDS